MKVCRVFVKHALFDMRSMWFLFAVYLIESLFIEGSVAISIARVILPTLGTYQRSSAHRRLVGVL